MLMDSNQVEQVEESLAALALANETGIKELTLETPQIKHSLISNGQLTLEEGPRELVELSEVCILAEVVWNQSCLCPELIPC